MGKRSQFFSKISEMGKWREGKGDELQTSGVLLSSELREQSIITLFVFFKQRKKYSVSKQVRKKKGKHEKSYTFAYKQKPWSWKCQQYSTLN